VNGGFEMSGCPSWGEATTIDRLPRAAAFYVTAFNDIMLYKGLPHPLWNHLQDKEWRQQSWNILLISEPGVGFLRWFPNKIRIEYSAACSELLGLIY
jgi:hypothetical protein